MSTDTRSWVLPVVQDPDNPEDYLLDLGEVSEHLGWAPGDTLEWSDNKDGTWTIKKIPTP